MEIPFGLPGLKLPFSFLIPEKTETIELSRSVDPETEIEPRDNVATIPFTGFIIGVHIEIPITAQDVQTGIPLIHVRVGKNFWAEEVPIVPKSGYIKTPGLKKTFYVFVPVKAGDQVWANIINYDKSNRHWVTVEVEIAKFKEIPIKI